MDLFEQLELAVERKRLYGVYPAKVTAIADPDQQGRVKVQLPWSPDDDGGSYEAWARLAVLMAGSSRGTWFIPDVGDEVLLMFEAGDPRRPYVVGALWNGQDAPPETMDSGEDNNLKSIVSRRGIRITLDDTNGQETLTLRTPKQTIVLKDGDPAVELRDGSGNTVKMTSAGITVTAASKVKVQAAQVEISAGQVTVNAGMSKFSGVVQADTVITNAIISASYSPGAGNIW
ncbi:MAG: hypothetical protein KC425_03135 [Anaerolineales bacterium]|nr:hypothetical protein [Anaerolineales bacterium]